MQGELNEQLKEISVLNSKYASQLETAHNLESSHREAEEEASALRLENSQ